MEYNTLVLGGRQFYHGLEVDVNRHLGRGLQFRGVYTFSKSIDDGDNMNTSVATNSPAFVANPLQPKADYGRASFDVSHAGVINATYDLPFGRGDTAQEHPRLERLIGNWQLSGIETLQSGLPFTPQLSYNPSNDGDTRNPVRPSWNPNFAGPVITGGPNQYFNPDAFIQPLPGTYGNVGRNVLQGPGLAETDLALANNFKLSERVNLQFRSEFFNVFNHTNFNAPNPVVYAAADRWTVTHRRSHYSYFHDFAPNSTGVEVVVVKQVWKWRTDRTLTCWERFRYLREYSSGVCTRAGSALRYFHSGRNRISHGDENTITAAASVSVSLRCKLTLASVPIE